MPLFSTSTDPSVRRVRSVHVYHPGYGCETQHPGFFFVFSTSIALMLLLAGCSDRASQDYVKEDTPYTRKVDSSIRNVAHRMASEGVGAEDSGEQGVDLSRRYSSEIVRVDKEGRIQCYISLDPFGENSIDSLRALSVFIEREEATLSLVQAWVPYGRIRPLAELSFVRRIRPPDYPALR